MKHLLLLSALLLLATPAQAALRVPAQPDSGQHVVDPADLITPEDEAEIQQIAARLLAQERVRLVVVTIDSMAQYGGARMNIEDYADRLFDTWNIGAREAGSLDESLGILVLVSRLDRKARIELGAGWGYSKDSEARTIMELRLVPAFKRGNYSSGLVNGTRALDRMARSLPPPREPLTQEKMMLFGGGGALGLFSLVSLIRSGTSGWAYSFWGTVFSILWAILKVLLTPSYSRRDRWGSRSYGSSSSRSSSWSSGGGSRSSGGRGGGATGSW